MDNKQGNKKPYTKPTKDVIHLTLATFFLPLATYLLSRNQKIEYTHGREKIEITRPLEITIMVWLLRNKVTPEKYKEVYTEIYHSEHESHTHTEKQQDTTNENRMIDVITICLYNTIKQTSDVIAARIQQYLYANGPATTPYIPDITDTHVYTASASASASTSNNSNQSITPTNMQLNTGNCNYGQEDAVPPSETDISFLTQLSLPSDEEMAIMSMSDLDFIKSIQTASVPGTDLTNVTSNNNIDLGFTLANSTIQQQQQQQQQYQQSKSGSIFDDDFDMSLLNSIGTPKGTPNTKRKTNSVDIILEKVIITSENKVIDELKKIEDIFKSYNENIYTHLVLVIKSIFNEMYNNTKKYI